MVEFLKSGLYDTIQDLGRYGAQDFGVPYSGAMDLLSAKRANSLLGNDLNDAVLEITIVGPKLKFHCNTSIALTGANLSPMLNSATIQLNKRHIIKPGDILTFGQRQNGCRTYLAVSGGFQTEIVMNSRSAYPTITEFVKLNKGDQLPVLNTGIQNNSNRANSEQEFDTSYSEILEVLVFKGMEFSLLSDFEKEKLWSTEFTVSKDSNRMAYQVDEEIPNNLDAIITSLVLPGTIQLTPSGKLIILMRDCQVTGGYPRILQVSEQSICHLSQKFFGEKFRFKCID